MRFIWGDDHGPATRRTDGIGYGALLMLGLVFWLALGALDKEARQAEREDAARVAASK